MSSMSAESYAAAGVDLAAAAHIKRDIRDKAAATFRDGLVSGPGGFGAVFDADPNSEYLLVSSTDSVGTKLRIAQAMDKHDTVGIDIVNHCVNDILPAGAEPLFFLDYIGLGETSDTLVSDLVSGLSRGCIGAGCALIGGETALLPGIYHNGDYDLVGFVVGRVRRDRFLKPERVRSGDCLIALPSNGLHTNGYSLVRSIFEIDEEPEALNQKVPRDGRTLGEALLEPHRLYLHLLRPVLDRISSVAHITGGGFIENIPRALSDGIGAELLRSSWEPPPLFDFIRNSGGISEEEMYTVFNMGVGMVIAVSVDNIDSVMAELPGSWIIGRTVDVEDNEKTRVRFV